jgi:hypothetical protein
MKKVLIFIFMLAFLSCKKSSTAPTVVMTYQISQCSDPWMDAGYNANKVATLKRFLEGKNIQVVSLKIEANCGQQAVCQACICAGCDKATVEVPEDDVADMEILKFKRQ